MVGMDFITVIPKTKLIMKNIARFEYLKHIHTKLRNGKNIL